MCLRRCGLVRPMICGIWMRVATYTACHCRLGVYSQGVASVAKATAFTRTGLPESSTTAAALRSGVLV